jgi:hypothetical protein
MGFSTLLNTINNYGKFHSNENKSFSSIIRNVHPYFTVICILHNYNLDYKELKTWKSFQHNCSNLKQRKSDLALWYFFFFWIATAQLLSMAVLIIQSQSEVYCVWFPTNHFFFIEINHWLCRTLSWVKFSSHFIR